MIQVAEPVLDGNELRYVTECIQNRQLSGGQFVERFEHAFAAWIGARHAVTTTSGTTALHLALVALGVQPGDEVLVPDLTFVATANAVLMCGAVPVFCDVAVATMTLCAERIIEDLITSRTVGIIPVHLYGNPADMAAVRRVAERYELFVLEDAAEAPGATYAGMRIGALGQAACFSFYANKLLTTGEGGMITTNSAELAARLRLLRGQAVDPHRRYWHLELGWNYRMTELQGAIGLAQVETADLALAKRRQVAAWYRAEVGPWQWQSATPDSAPSWWMNAAVLAEGMPPRDAVIARLAARGVASRPVFYPLHTLPAFAQHWRGDTFPGAEALSARGIVLPSHGRLGQCDVRHICEELRACYLH